MVINQWPCYPDGAAEFPQCWAGAAWALAQCEPGACVKTAQASSSLNIALKPRVVTCLNRQQCSKKPHLSEGTVGMDTVSLGGSSATQSTCPETVLALGKNLRSHGQGEWVLLPLTSPPTFCSEEGERQEGLMWVMGEEEEELFFPTAWTHYMQSGC